VGAPEQRIAGDQGRSGLSTPGPSCTSAPAVNASSARRHHRHRHHDGQRMRRLELAGRRCAGL